jgi:hypothetical protein
MRRLLPLTPDQLARAEERLRNPAPGSSIAAARDFGIDLTLLAEQLRLPPSERARQMLEVCQMAEEVRGRASWTRRLDRG